MTTDTIKLFDNNNRLLDSFDEEIEKVLISIHGQNYYDVDEPIKDTRELKNLKTKVKENLNIKEDNKSKVYFKDFVPVLFFACIFFIILFAGYYFLNTIDLMTFFK